MCQKEFATGSLDSHLDSQHGMYHARLVVDKEELEEVCTQVPIKPVV